MMSWEKCWNALFSYRNAEDYTRILVCTLVVNLVCFMINLMQAFLIRPPKGTSWGNKNTLAVVSLISGCLALINVGCLISALIRPRTATASAIFLLIAMQLILYCCEVIIYFQPDPYIFDDETYTTSDKVVSAVCTVFLFVVQFFVGLAMWRYWDFMKYNYDGSVTISLRSSLLGADAPSRDSLGAPLPPQSDQRRLSSDAAAGRAWPLQ